MPLEGPPPAKLTLFREIAGQWVLRTLATNERDHTVFTPRQRGDIKHVAPYRVTIFVPDEKETAVVPFLRAHYGEPPKLVPPGEWFRKGEPFAGAAWAVPGELDIWPPLLNLADCAGDEGKWRRGWQALKVTPEAAIRMDRRSPFVPHVRSVATYAIHISDESQFVIVLESTRKHGFADECISDGASASGRAKFGKVIARVGYLVETLQSAIIGLEKTELAARKPSDWQHTPTVSLPEASEAPVEPRHPNVRQRAGLREDVTPVNSPMIRSDIVPRRREGGLDLGSKSRPTLVFVSHAHEDKELARQLVNCLQSCLGLPRDSLFCSSHAGAGVTLGEEVVGSLSRALNAAVVVVALVTPSSVRSTWVQGELGYARFASKKLCCLVGPGVEAGELPEVVRGLHTADLLDRSSLAKLVDAIAQNCSFESITTEQREAAMSTFYDALCSMTPAAVAG